MKSREIAILIFTAATFILFSWRPIPCYAQAAAGGAAEEPVTITAQEIEHNARAKKTRAKKNVLVKYKQRVISGQEGEINHDTGAGYMSGGVRMADKDLAMDAERVDFDLKTGNGTLQNAKGRLGTSFYFTGIKIERTTEDHFQIEDGSCSTCPFPDQDWRLKASTVSMTVEGYAFITGMTFLAGDVPVFYLPYFLIPVKTKRATGFLIPRPSYSGNNGFYVTNRFFWAMADSADATFTHNHRGSAGEGGELELRYIFSERAKGQLNTEYFHQNPTGGQPGKELWTLLFNHAQPLPLGADNLIKLDLESKDSITKRWEDDLSLRSRRFTDSFFLIRESWTAANLNIQARSKQSVVPGVENRIDELPSITFINQKQRLFGLPVYWFFDSGYTAFRTEETPSPNAPKTKFAVDRMDASPGLSMILAPAPWISLEPELRYRSTWYSAGVDATGARVAEAFTRDFYTASTVLTGPRLFRVFDPSDDVRIKHVITPKVAWMYIPGYDFDGADRQKVKPLDGVDLSAPANTVTFTLMNQVLFREPAGTDGEARVSERVKFNIEQTYNFIEASRLEIPDKPKRPLASTVLDLRTLPMDWLMINLSGQYNTYLSQLDVFHLETGFKMAGVFNFALDHVASYPSDAWDTAYLELILANSATMDFSGVYNEKSSYFSDLAVRFLFHRGCWGFAVSGLYKKKTLADTEAGLVTKDETKIMFSINLLGLGDSIGEVAQPLAGKKL